VKNLENVQGDERDIIIMSVCYAPGPTGRMVMNFGPINQRGGEKRLNVIFSRARMHMAIVSSIRGSQITNDHNDGANALRRFLEYAEALSVGDTARANGILELVSPLQRRSLRSPASSPVVEGLADALRQRGLIVEVDHGRSRFRCDLAIRQTQDDDHYLAVIIDTQERTTLGSLEERSIVHPMILESFGWRVVHVLTKDWWSQPDVVLSTIEAAMRR
jgi:REase_MTES_1575